MKTTSTILTSLEQQFRGSNLNQQHYNANNVTTTVVASLLVLKYNNQIIACMEPLVEKV